ncbi:MAG: flippase-like domain-containing protein [Bacteroidetes bacterium]|nr:flippase-like domain-containing protein [Bacteroidota bacterium]
MTWLIADRLFIRGNFKTEFAGFLQHLHSDNYPFFIAALLLVAVNWFLETYKWKILLQSGQSFVSLFKAVLAGVTLGFITPGRGGEFVGRAMYLEGDNQPKAFYLSVIGGLAQAAATLVAASLLLRLWRDDSFLYALVTGAALIFLLFYFRYDWFNRFISSNSFLQSRGWVLQRIHVPKFFTQLKVFFLSLLRFTVYLHQYVLLLVFFGSDSDLVTLSACTAVFLLFQTFSPLMPLLDLSFRGGTALYVFSESDENQLVVLSAVTFVWLMNLVLPALLGYLFILRKRISTDAL